MRRPRLLALFSFCLFAYAAPASAEIIQLLDGTKLSGTIVHCFEGVYTIDTSDGNRVKLPKEKIKSITFELPPPRAEFSTPEKTFEIWRKALTHGDIEAAIDCYALMYQGMVMSQMTDAGPDGIKAMKGEMAKTKFTIKNTSTKGETALLKVTRSYGEDVQTAEIAFVKENGEWKMRP
jgi:hypothetical protein